MNKFLSFFNLKAQNKITKKLSCYFAVSFLVFSVVIGSVFMMLFRRHTIQLHKDEMQKRAVAISDTLSGFMSGSHRGYGAYLRFLDDFAMADVWIIDSSYHLITHSQAYKNKSSIQYSDLPKDGDKIIKEVFEGKTSFSESFSDILNQPTITIGMPVYNNGEVISVLLLHSPVNGMNIALKQGFTMLFISISCALFISFVFSLWLSKTFTDPIINKEAAEALRMEKMRRDFVSNISHELRTPVAVLRSSLEALTDEIVTEPEEIASYHREMLSETLYLQRLVGDLLDLSRLQNADFAIEKEEVDLISILEDSIHTIQHIAKDKNVKILFEKNNLPQKFEGDYGRLRQMFLILLDNAIKFSPKNSSIIVTINTSNISIQDCGSGILEQELPHLFERYFKSNSEQNKTGTGLGLAIAAQIAKRHNMTITAQNAVNGGAIFTIHDIRNKKK